MIWPFRKLTPDQQQEREWKRYRDRIASTLVRQGYRGDPVDWKEAVAWANGVVEEAKKRRAEAIDAPR